MSADTKLKQSSLTSSYPKDTLHFLVGVNQLQINSEERILIVILVGPHFFDAQIASLRRERIQNSIHLLLRILAVIDVSLTLLSTLLLLRFATKAAVALA